MSRTELYSAMQEAIDLVPEGKSRTLFYVVCLVVTADLQRIDDGEISILDSMGSMDSLLVGLSSDEKQAAIIRLGLGSLI